MHPRHFATCTPNKPAIIMHGSGEQVTYFQLDARSNQGAHLIRQTGLKPGDVIAIFMENHPRYLDITWAAQRSGLCLVCLSSKLTSSEAEYIITDSGAKMVVTSKQLGEVTSSFPQKLNDILLFMASTPDEGFRSWEEETAALPASAIDDETGGTVMLYSSGTTGKPKGVRWPTPEDPSIDALPVLTPMARDLFGFNEDTIYLSPAPLYHAAPLHWCMTTHRLGGTVVVMENYDPVEALEHYRVTASQWVPTHFVRMLKLPKEERQRHDLSSLKMAIHAAAPCPVSIKKEMIEWWGAIISEYYSATEGCGFTMINSQDWLDRPGSVGKAAVGIIHICDDKGEPVPSRTEGNIHFEGGPPFEYHNDPEKTSQSFNQYGWATLGDVGWVDEDNYLYLTDRKSFMIISGGVNIYPQELENILALHREVADAAVVSAPDPEMGEKVVAILQPMDWANANENFAEEINVWLQGKISRVKMPRQIDFSRELPRHPTGKLYKRLLRDAYWGKASEETAS